MKVLLLLTFVAACYAMRPISPSLDGHWGMFKDVHNKKYASHDEEMLRRFIWEQRLHKINTHNLEADLGTHSYWLGINEFADLTEEEIRNMNGFRYSGQKPISLSPLKLKGKVPDTVDWRKSGCVTGVKDQKQCGSCWAFSATGSLEGQHCLKGNKTLVSLSEQNLVDCSRPEGNNGCGGGLMDRAFEYIKKNNGIDTEKCYPYEAKDDDCRFKKSCIGATLKSWHDIPTGDEKSLKEHVGTIGPISVAIDASSSKFHFYKHGVYDDQGCSSTRLDHGVLAVGYGTYQGKDYWLVKNSWGETWGTKGYIMMSRNKDNQCGIATQSSYPTV